MKLRWHGEARAEADAAVAFYNEKQPVLAQRFLDDLEDALHRIQRHPQPTALWTAIFASAGWRISHSE